MHLQYARPSSPELPLALRALAATTITTACSAIAVALVCIGMYFILAGSLSALILTAAGALVMIAGSSAAWFHLLPAVRWLGLPLTVGITLPTAWFVLFGVLGS